MLVFAIAFQKWEAFEGGLRMIYTLTVHYKTIGFENRGWNSVSVQIDQDILPQVGGTVCLLYSEGDKVQSLYIKVDGVIYYLQKRGNPIEEELGRRKGQGMTDIQVILKAASPIEERKIDLVTSPNNRFSLGKWEKNEKKRVA